MKQNLRLTYTKRCARLRSLGFRKTRSRACSRRWNALYAVLLHQSLPALKNLTVLLIRAVKPSF